MGHWFLQLAKSHDPHWKCCIYLASKDASLRVNGSELRFTTVFQLVSRPIRSLPQQNTISCAQAQTITDTIAKPLLSISEVPLICHETLQLITTQMRSWHNGPTSESWQSNWHASLPAKVSLGQQRKNIFWRFYFYRFNQSRRNNLQSCNLVAQWVCECVPHSRWFHQCTPIKWMSPLYPAVYPARKCLFSASHGSNRFLNNLYWCSDTKIHYLIHILSS